MKPMVQYLKEIERKEDQSKDYQIQADILEKHLLWRTLQCC